MVAKKKCKGGSFQEEKLRRKSVSSCITLFSTSKKLSLGGNQVLQLYNETGTTGRIYFKFSAGTF